MPQHGGMSCACGCADIDCNAVFDYLGSARIRRPYTASVLRPNRKPPAKKARRLTVRLTTTELEGINQAVAKLWPNIPPISLSAKVRERLRQRVEEVLKNKHKG